MKKMKGQCLQDMHAGNVPSIKSPRPCIVVEESGEILPIMDGESTLMKTKASRDSNAERIQQVQRAPDGWALCSRIHTQEDTVPLPIDTFSVEVDDTIRIATRLPG